MLLSRVLKSGFVNFWRNIWLSSAATFIMVITLTILTITLLVVNVSNFAIKDVQKKVDISIYFKPEVSEVQIFSIEGQLKNNLPEIAAMNYISAGDALKAFRIKHQDDPVIMQSLDQLTDNPLPPTLQIKAHDLSQYPKIADELNKPAYQQYISKINFQDNRLVIERLSRILNTIKKIGIILAGIFAFIAVLVIFNTIRLTIYNRREEVEIMRLVGATNWYIRWPFIIESMITASAAAIITILIMLPILHYLVPKINYYLAIDVSSGNIVYFSYTYLFLIQFGIALGLGILSSLIAIRRYLRV